jgi:hypothetical protein
MSHVLLFFVAFPVGILVGAAFTLAMLWPEYQAGRRSIASE